MTKQKKLLGLNGTLNEKVPFTHRQILEALFSVDDMLDRAQIPYFLLEGIARQVHDNVPYFSLNQVDVGVNERYVKESGKSMLQIVAPNLYTDENTMSYEHNGVPVVIWIIHENWKFFKNPEAVFYETGNFMIPNPFNIYWKSRFLIR